MTYRGCNNMTIINRFVQMEKCCFCLFLSFLNVHDIIQTLGKNYLTKHHRHKFTRRFLTFPLWVRIPFHRGLRTESKLSIPYGVAASASAAMAKAVIVRTFCCSSTSPCSMISTRLFKCGSMAQPIKMAICWTILIPAQHAMEWLVPGDYTK